MNGNSSEPSIAAIVGNLIAWPVRQLHDEQRLVGVPGWRIAVRRFDVRDRAALAETWRAVAEAAESGREAPALVFRVDGGEWRAIWPAALQLFEQRRRVWAQYEWTIEAALPVWAAVTRHIEPLDEAGDAGMVDAEEWLQ